MFGDFKLKGASAVLKPFKVLTAATAPKGANARPTKVTEVEMVIEVNAENQMKAIEAIFPGVDTYCKQVAGLEQECKGEDRTARTKLQNASIKIWYGDDKDPAADVVDCPINAKAKLRVGTDGEAVLVLKPRMKLTNGELTAVAQLLAADVRIDLEPCQQSFAETGDDEGEEAGDGEDGEKKGKGKGRGKKAEGATVTPLHPKMTDKGLQFGEGSN